MLRQTLVSNRNREHLARPAALAAAVLAISALLLPGLAAAADDDTAARKYARGLAGITLGFLELPGNIVQETRTNGPASGLTIGVAVGLGKIVVRELAGVYELITAPFPMPANFEPVLQPEFPWQYFESHPGRLYGFSNVYLYEEELEIDKVPGASVKRRGGALVVSFPNSLLFAFDSAELPEAAAPRLEGLVKTLKVHPETKVVVVGYADSTGHTDYNRALSRNRAKAVRAFLIDKGIAAGRIDTTGYGESYPVASNDTPIGRRDNRRVEVELRSGGVALYR